MVPPWQRDKSGYLSTGTIAAISSALGGAVGLIRVSGPEALMAAERLAGFSPAPESRKLVRATLRASNQTPLDDAMVAVFRAPASFTGEDVAEFQIHGSSQVATQILAELSTLGIRQALPGEFSFRAVRNGKMTINQAQAVADLIAAKNVGAARLALEKMSGTQNRLLTETAEEIRRLATAGEVGIDFSDQDLPELSLPHLTAQISPIQQTLWKLADSFERGHRIQEGVRVAFVGLPNAGKSSFFNALLGEDRSIVSEIAGTTRDVIRESLCLRGQRVEVTLRLEDTAGLRDSADQVERIGIERTMRSARDADLILLIVDAQTTSWKQLGSIWMGLGAPSDHTIVVLTKADLCAEPALNEARLQARQLGVATCLTTSTVIPAGISEAAAAIADYCEKWVKREPEEVVLTHLEQVEAIQAALQDLKRAESAPELALFAADLRQALHSLAPLIGETMADDILGRIFSQFCIGK